MPYIFYENSEYIIVEKEHGLNTEPDRKGNPNLMFWLQEARPHCFRRSAPYPLHRLDRPVSGLLIVAKKRSAHRIFQQMFEKRQIEKHYRALVHGEVLTPKGILTYYHKKDTVHFRAIVGAHPFEGSAPVKLSYRVVGIAEGRTQVDIRLHTGRYHQIRAQMAAIGHPIVGDLLYGAKPIHCPNTIALRAYRLAFDCPFEKKRKVFDHLPDDFSSRWT